MSTRGLAYLILASLPALSACDDTAPSAVSTLSIQTPAPAAGSTIQTTGTPPGAFIDRGSGKLSIPVRFEAGADEPTARLFVYLKDAAGVTCGQNNPDAPNFGLLKRATVVDFTVTGFQVYRLPCDVYSVRAVLHRRASLNLNTELTTAEIIAEATLAIRYTIQ